MIRTSSIAATLLMLMSTASSFAASTQPLGPSQTGPVVTGEHGEVASPGDPFFPSVRVQRVGTESYVMRCWVKENEKFSNGNSIIVLKNTSTKTIPKGTKIVLTYADGTQETVIAFVDIPPGGAIGIQGPPDATPDNFSCTASASGAILPPAVSDAPTGNPAIPNP